MIRAQSDRWDRWDPRQDPLSERTVAGRQFPSVLKPNSDGLHPGSFLLLVVMLVMPRATSSFLLPYFILSFAKFHDGFSTESEDGFYLCGHVQRGPLPLFSRLAECALRAPTTRGIGHLLLQDRWSEFDPEGGGGACAGGTWCAGKIRSPTKDHVVFAPDVEGQNPGVVPIRGTEARSMCAFWTSYRSHEAVMKSAEIRHLFCRI